MRPGTDARINHACRFGAELEKVRIASPSGRKREVAEFEPACGRRMDFLNLFEFCCEYSAGLEDVVFR